jgi:hypothetical protein
MTPSILAGERRASAASRLTRPRVRSAGQWLACLLVLSIATVVSAADPQPADADNVEPGSAAPLDRFLPPDHASDTPQLMQAAAQRLADGQLDEETTRLHDEILDRLRQVLDAAQRQSAQRFPVPAESPGSNSQAGAAVAGGTGDEPQRRDQTSDAAESSDVPGDAELSDGEIQRRRNLATSVWGHLPPRVRDRMEGAFSERFLPQYDDLVRRYYEALATESTDSP